MYLRIVMMLLFLFTSLIFAQKTTEMLKTFDDSVSYSIGQNIARNLKGPEMHINFEALAQGMKDQVSGTSLLSEEEIQYILTLFNQKLMAKQNEQLKAVKEKNKAEGLAFLEQNKKKEGVVTLPNGLQYKVISSGNGPSPKATDTVKVHYKGTLIDGREFDSSYRRGEPAVFPLNKVIKGWTEGLQLMKVGDKWTLYIPSELGYGENGAGEMIGPNSTLIFDVELLGIGNDNNK